MRRILAGILLSFLFGTVAMAHSGGFTFEKTVSNYFVDIGANKQEIVQGELTLFEYNLYPVTDPNNLADFDNVYVTVGDEKGIEFTSFLYRPDGLLTVMSYAFPKSGKYEMSARFNKGSETLTEVSFPIEVRSSSPPVGMIAVGLACAVLGAAVGFWLSRSRTAKIS